MTAAYEEHKCSFRPPSETASTSELCAQQGLCFVPMVIEAHAGAWGQSAKKVLASISRNAAASLKDSPDAVSLRIVQRLSIALHRENARAILKRCGGAQAAARPDELASASADLT